MQLSDLVRECSREIDDAIVATEKKISNSKTELAGAEERVRRAQDEAKKVGTVMESRNLAVERAREGLAEIEKKILELQITLR